MCFNRLSWMLVLAVSLVSACSVPARATCIDQNNDFVCDQTYDPVPAENDRIRQQQEDENRVVLFRKGQRKKPDFENLTWQGI